MVTGLLYPDPKRSLFERANELAELEPDTRPEGERYERRNNEKDTGAGGLLGSE